MSIERRSAPGIAAISIVLLVASASSAQDYPRVRSEAAQALVPKLEAIATWCGTAKLLRERDQTFGDVLALDPSNAAARKALQYEQAQDGSWKQSAKYLEPKNTSSAALPELAKRRAEAVAPFLEKVLDAIDTEKKACAAEETNNRLRDLLRFGSENAKLRTALGEARLKDRWVLTQTVTAAERRKVLTKMAQSCLDGMSKAEEAALTPFEKSLDFKWTYRRKTPTVRVIATVPLPEAESVLRVADASHRFFLKALSVEGKPWENLTIVLLNPPDGLAFLKVHPDTPDNVRKNPEWFASCWMYQTSHLVQYHIDASVRLHRSICRTTGTSLTTVFNLVEEHGALYSGLVVYLGARLTGLRQPVYGAAEDNSPAETELLNSLYDDPKLDWMKLAAGAIVAKRAPPLAALFAKAAHRLSATDALMSWAFASYIVEARPDNGGAFVQMSAVNGPERAAQDVFGIALSSVDDHFRRWVTETADLGGT